MNNKKLVLIAVAMLPFVVISFFFKNKEGTNFILEKEENLPLEEKDKYTAPTVKVLIDDKIQMLDLEEYTTGVVAGEMPASFSEEALKAQAVASRSFALYRKNNSNNEYDLTDDVNSQVYIGIDEMKKKWNDQFSKYYERVKKAVLDTKGQVLTYNGEIIEAFYFSMSSGATQNSEYVFRESRDYLQSVDSIYDNENVKNFEVNTEISKEDFIKKLGLTCSDIEIDDIVYNESGYIENIIVCGKKMTGQNFRMSLGLRSANVKITLGDPVKMTTKGHGHGVGLSQYGANGYALAGYTYEDILKHYYKGVEITDLKSV